MDPLQQGIEGKCAAGGNDDLAIEDELLRLQRADRRDQLRKIASHHAAGLRLQLHFLAVAKNYATEAVPFRLVLPVVADRNLFDR